MAHNNKNQNTPLSYSMCGILGAISNEEIEGSKFSKALNQLENRGPDDEGYRCLERMKNFSGSDTVQELDMPGISRNKSKKWIGCRRLSITGDSSCHQPMSHEKLSIIYEGELYNYQDLRKQLSDKGHSFDTDGDTEVFLHAYSEWGLRAFEKFEGKWAAAIYDSFKDEVLCFRDYFGTKPLYYVNEQRFLFSTKISPLLHLKKNPPRENTEIKLDYLKHGILDHTDQTFFQEVKQLRPREYLRFDEEKIEIEELPSTEEETVSAKEAVENSIKSKIPESEWCITLSGGLDSSIAACILSKEISKGYSANIAEEKYENSEYWNEVVQRTDIDNKEIDIALNDLFRKIPESMEIQEEPTNMLPAQVQQIIYEEIGRTDNKVVLTGSGADELFLGYPQFVPEAVKESLRKEGIRPGLKLLYNHLHRFDTYMMVYLLKILLPYSFKSSKIQTESRFITEPENYNDSNIKTNPSNLSESREDQLRYLWYPSIMRFTDKNSGAMSLETREGFLSRQLKKSVEESDDLENFRNGYTKKLLRDAFRDIVPDKIIERKDKIGYMPTDNSAYTPEIRQKLLETFKSESFLSRKNIKSEKIIREVRKDHLNFHVAYRYYCYEIWARKYIDTEEI